MVAVAGDEKVTIAHGAGGKETWEIVNKLIVRRIPEHLRRTDGGVGIDKLDDGAVIRVGDKYIVVTIDSYTVKPLKFPGGDLGVLAASGTINDLLMMGARPVAVEDAIIVEEGVDMGLVNEIVSSYIKVVTDEGIAVIGGDFKVMPKGSLDTMVITSTGIGIAERPIVDTGLRVGDDIVVTGPIAEHGATIIAAQLGMLETVKGLSSDIKPLTKIMLPLLEKFSNYIHAARDPTRGGIASTLNEWASAIGKTIILKREEVPIKESVRSFLDMLGIDPLHVASEGIAVLGVDPEVTDELVRYLRSMGQVHASVIGKVIEPPSDIVRGKVLAETEVGGLVFVDTASVLVPRIC
ncbi:MAG: hydrogenase expression/formation protein HypE [Thermoprotei archaeon]|nr:MAG: hydrogenase expression/formation protein HypE [Thermoprotei archaeon]